MQKKSPIIRSKKVPSLGTSFRKLANKYKNDPDVEINNAKLSINILVPMRIDIPLGQLKSNNKKILAEVKDKIKETETEYRYYTSMNKKIENISSETPVPENQYKYFQQLLNGKTNFYRKNISEDSSQEILNPFTAIQEYQRASESLYDGKFTLSESMFIAYWISKGMPQIIDLEDAKEALGKNERNISTIVFSVNKKFNAILHKGLKTDVNEDIIFLRGSTNSLNKLPISITNTYKSQKIYREEFKKEYSGKFSDKLNEEKSNKEKEETNNV